MQRMTRLEGGSLAHLSVALASRLVHNAGAAGKAVTVMDARTRRALQRGFLRLLSGTRQPIALRVSGEVAHGLGQRSHGAAGSPPTYHLALGFDRFGRGTFLLRPALGTDAGQAGHEACLLREQLIEDLRQYLRNLPPPLEEKSAPEEM